MRTFIHIPKTYLPDSVTISKDGETTIIYDKF